MPANTVPHFDAQTFFRRFSHHSFSQGETRLHYVAGGEGAPLILLPGWPQSWYCWRHVMPLLADAGRRVIAVDLRGMGDSAIPAEGYDTGTLAADIAALVAGLNDGPADIACHDVGSWVGYALAADHPQQVKRLALFDALIPGLPLPATAPSALSPAEQAIRSWHFSFNLLADLPEILLTGREKLFLDWLFDNKTLNPQAIGPADRAEYLRVNSRPGALRAALSYYRQALSEQQLKQTLQRSQQRLSMPVFTGGAEYGAGDKLYSSLAAQCDRLTGITFPQCGHYIPEEAPVLLADTLLEFFARTTEA